MRHSAYLLYLCAVWILLRAASTPLAVRAIYIRNRVFQHRQFPVVTYFFAVRRAEGLLQRGKGLLQRGEGVLQIGEACSNVRKAYSNVGKAYSKAGRIVALLYLVNFCDGLAPLEAV